MSNKTLFLAALWCLLAGLIINELRVYGSELYYPVVIAWLGGLVSIELFQSTINDRKKNRS